MTKLTEKIQDCGLIFGCGDDELKTSSISHKESMKILELIKRECIAVINNVGLSADDTRAVINAILDVK